MRSRLVPRQNVRRQVYKLDQLTRIIGALARVLSRCLTVVATAKMIRYLGHYVVISGHPAKLIRQLVTPS
jgi:hypothetical protein